MTLRRSHDNDSLSHEEGVFVAVGGLRSEKGGRIRKILDILADFDQNNISGIAQAFISFPEESSVHRAATRYFSHLKRGLAQTFIIPNGAVLDNKNVVIGPYYCIKYCTEYEWSLLIKGHLLEKGDDKIEGFCYVFPDHFPLICVPNREPSAIFLDHEIRHARDYYIIAEQPTQDTVIAREILGYLAGTRGTQSGKIVLLQSSSNPYNISPEDHTLISLIFDAIDKLDSVNLDLLSITPLRKWPKLLSSGRMGRITHDHSSNIRLKKDIDCRSAQEWADQNGISPHAIMDCLIYGHSIIWEDLWRFSNIHTLELHSGDIQGDIAEIIKNMKGLRKVILKRKVYDKISPDFIAVTSINFEIVD